MGHLSKNQSPTSLIETVSLTLIFWTIAPPLTQNETTKTGKKIYGQPDFCKGDCSELNWACANLSGVELGG
jgi:hypothetical protein